MKYEEIKQFNEDDDYEDDDSIPVYSHSSNIYKFFIDDYIGDPITFRNFFSCLSSATKKDIIEIHLNTPGGNVNTAIQLRNMIFTCNAKVIAICHGTVASAGTFIALSCPKIVVMPNTIWMLHACSYGTFGNQIAVKEQVDFFDKELWRLTNNVYKGFLNEYEINNMIINKRELWMNTEEIIKRLKKLKKYLTSNFYFV